MHQIMSRVRMTSLILALVLGSIVGSIAFVSGAIYLNLHAQALSKGLEQQSINIGIAATILERRLSGSQLTWTSDGKLGAFQSLYRGTVVRQFAAPVMLPI
jgi:methyl-accepting chemotaxis protein